MGSSDCPRAWFLGLLAVVALAGRDSSGGGLAGGQAEKTESRNVGEQVDAVIKDLKNA